MADRIGAAAVSLGRALNDEQSEARAFDPLCQRTGHAVEAPEDALGLVRGQAGSLIANAHHGTGAFPAHIHLHVDVVA